MAFSEIVGYYRVSTKSQGAEGLGMAAQRDAVERYAKSVSLPIIAFYEEVETGSKADLRNRPQLVAALAHVRRSGALLVIARLDRLARNVFVTSQLLESGIEFVACDNPHASRLTIYILAAMAEHESRMISARVKAAIAAARARGRVFKNYSKLSPQAIRMGVDSSRAATIKRTQDAYADLVPIMLELRLAGNTQEAIAARLNEMGQTNQFGRPWTRNAVGDQLNRQGLGKTLVARRHENHLTGSIQASGVAASRSARIRRTRLYYEPIIPLLRDLHRAGLSSVAIAQELNGRKVRPQGGSAWYPSIVLSVLRSEGIANEPVPGRVGLKLPAIQQEGRRLASLRVSSLAAAYRNRVMPIISWLHVNGGTNGEIAGYLNAHGYDPMRAQSWNSKMVGLYISRYGRKA